MQVIPAIDLRGGKFVRLEQGDYGRETVFGDDPAAAATRWVAAGASRLHIVDLDGARDGVRANTAAVDAILAAVSVPLQLAGGIRSAQSAIELLSLGADRVVFGTAAIEAPDEVRATIDHSGADAVIVGVDALRGVVSTHGWTQATRVRAVDLMTEMTRIGVRRFMYTDTERDGTLSHPNFGSIAEVLETAPYPVIVAGGIATIEDLARLSALGAEAAVTGLAIYSGALDLRRAIEEIECGGANGQDAVVPRAKDR